MKKPVCFLIDDDPDDQEIFLVALEDVDPSCHCVTADNGVAALEKLNSDKTFTPDFIFLDLNMPFLSGKKCLEELKKSENLQKIPVIIYSTSSHPRDIEETSLLGADHFLIKPSNINLLTRFLTELIQKKDLPFLLTSEI